MPTLSVDLGDRAYPIWIEATLQASLSLLSANMTKMLGSQVMVVSSGPVAAYYLESVCSALQAPDRQLDVVTIPDGESHKTLSTVESILDALLQHNHDRKTTLVALGGGVTGDIVGFAAAVYQRGVNFIQIPTTLLAQVDSSVGGKTGVNHPLGKNMIGAFHQPQAVLMGLDVLHTLSDRHYCAGLAEVVKYGLIYDADFFAWLEENAAGLLVKQTDLLEKAILRSCEIKAAVVAEDEKESGIRAILNLGHTFGHALEAGLGYGEMLHGEAVAVGMLMAVELSHLLGYVPVSLVDRTHRLLVALALPVTFSHELAVADVIALMQRDKKVQNKQLRLVLLKACGEAFIATEFEEHLLDLVISNRQNALSETGTP